MYLHFPDGHRAPTATLLPSLATLAQEVAPALELANARALAVWAARTRFLAEVSIAVDHNMWAHPHNLWQRACTIFEDLDESLFVPGYTGQPELEHDACLTMWSDPADPAHLLVQAGGSAELVRDAVLKGVAATPYGYSDRDGLDTSLSAADLATRKAAWASTLSADSVLIWQTQPVPMPRIEVVADQLLSMGGRMLDLATHAEALDVLTKHPDPDPTRARMVKFEAVRKDLDKLGPISGGRRAELLREVERRAILASHFGDVDL